VSLRWKKAPGAAYYDVYRADGGAEPRLRDAVKVTHWVDNAVLAGIPYRYYIRACTASGLASRPTNQRLIEMPVTSADTRSAASP
jgi:fibronectin type 3 domain-containing protein